MVQYISPIEQAYKVISWIFEQEIRQDGLLSDVYTFFDANTTKDIIRPPLLWFEKENITFDDGVQNSNLTRVTIPFNLICGVDVNNDMKEAELEGINLASRCITTAYKNIHKNHPYKDYIYIREFAFNELEPNGIFQITGKTKLLPAARVHMSLTVELDMMKYLTTEGESISFDEITTVDHINIEEILLY